MYEGRRWSYREISRESDRLAHSLVQRNIQPRSRIAIYLDRSVEMVIALLGILKAGAAYVPIDPGYPLDRIRLILDDAGVSGVVTISKTKDRLPEDASNIVLLDDNLSAFDNTDTEALRAAAELPATLSSDIAYVIYTSGSTGTPKGVQGTHRASMNRFAWMWTTYPFHTGEVCCQKTSLAFVDSIWEIFGPLLGGIPSVILPQETVLDPELLLQALARERVTRIVLVPSQLRALLEHAPNLSQRVPELKMWSCSGELLPSDLAKRFRAAFPHATLLNIYGSSEVAADATCHELSSADNAAVVPIGRPISNVQTYIVDACMNPSPIGLRGEIYIGGDGLARGYLNRPELTAERFVQNWLAPEQGGRLYRTGDLGRWRDNGEIEYLGRADTQVKLRGQRIELGEIESTLASHPAVREAVVALRGHAEQQKLAAYLVLQEHALKEAIPSAGELRRHLRAKLTEVMVPSEYWQIDTIPSLASGKVNRVALESIAAIALTDEQEWIGPRTETEAQLATIWRELLQLDKVDIEQNFFELGGHSLLALQMTARIRRALEVELPVRSVFNSPTIAALAEEVDRARASGLRTHAPTLRTYPAKARDVLDQLDALTTDEAKRLVETFLHET